MQVRIVLRDRETGWYFRGRGDWVSNAYDALTFANIIEAETFCRSHSLEALQLIQRSGYFFRSPRYRPPQPGFAVAVEQRSAADLAGAN